MAVGELPYQDGMKYVMRVRMGQTGSENPILDLLRTPNAGGDDGTPFSLGHQL